MAINHGQYNVRHGYMCARARYIVIALVLAVVFEFGLLISGVFSYTRGRAHAATSSTLNFQARLQTNTGALVPDGSYNIEFKLYNAASLDGGESLVQGACQTLPGPIADEDCLWVENRAGVDKVTVKNGYFSVNLGSVTAFPGTINWDQELWLGMNIGGSGGPTWDGEMSPRFKLTAIPFAFKAAYALNVLSNPTSTVFTNSADVSVKTGDASGGSSNSGNLIIDNGTATGTTGTIAIGTANTSGITVGRSGVTTTLQGSTSISGGINYGAYYRDASGNIATTAAGTTGQCLLATTGNAPSWGTCSGVSNLQGAYDGGNTITTADATNVLFTLADTATDANLLVNIATGSSGRFAVQNNGTDVLGVTSTAVTLAANTSVTGANTLTVGTGATTLGGTLTVNGTGTSAFNMANTGQLSVVSSLASGARATPLVAITQANDAVNNSTGVLLNVANSDTATTAAVANITQSSTAAANALTITSASTTAAFTVATPAGGTAIAATGTTSGTGINLNTLTTGTGLSATGTTTGSALSVSGTALTSGNGLLINMTSNAMTSGKAINITGAAAAVTADVSTALINVTPTRTLTAAATRNDSSNFLNLVRSITTNNASAIYNMSGALANLQSNCTQTSGSCVDTANILNLSQQNTNSSGTVLNLIGAGSGNLAALDASNSVANGLSIDIQSNSNTKYAFRATANNSATNGLIVLGNGNVGVGTATPSELFSVGSSSQFQVNSTGAVTSTGLTITSGGADITGGIDNNNGGITNAGSITGVGSDITATAGLTISSGGVGGLTLDSASGTIMFDASSLRRQAAGTTFMHLDDSADTLLSIVNPDGAAVANLSVEGAVTASSYNGSGASLTSLNASNISSGTLNDSRLSSNVLLLNSDQTITGIKTFDNGLILENSSSTTAGAIRWSGTDFEGYDGVSWVSFTDTGGGGGGSPSPALTSVTKSLDETVNNSTTIQPDNDLKFTVGANETWTFRYVLQASSSAVADLKLTITAPSGATCRVGFIDEQGSLSDSGVACAATITLNGTGNNEVYEVVGTIENGATLGDVTLEWAQGTQEASNTTIKAGSFLSAAIDGGGLQFLQGGNAFGATAVIGTTDNEGFNFITNGSTVLSLSAGGNTTISGLLYMNGDVEIGNNAADNLTINSTDVALPNGLNFDSNTLVIDSTTNTVGINNVSPDNRLNVNTPAAADSAAQAMIYTDGVNNKGLVIQAISGQTVNLLELQNNSGLSLGYFNASGQLGLGRGSGSTGLIQLHNSTNNNITSLQSGVATNARTITLPDEDGTVCIQNATSCGFVLFGEASAQTDVGTDSSIFINKTGATGNILALQKNGNGVFTVGNNGGLRLTLDSNAALTVENASGTDYFNVDTSGNIVRVGGSGDDAVGVLFVFDSKNTAGNPTGVNGAQYYNSYERESRCFEDNTWVDCRGVTRPASRRWTFLEYPGSGTAFSLVGDVATAGTAPTASAATTTEPGMLNYATTGVLNAVNHVSGNAKYDTDNQILFQTYIRLPAVTTVRMWSGITSVTAANMAGSANPAFNHYAAFRFDTGAGDVNFKCITKDAVAQNIIDSGVAANTNGRDFEIRQSATDVTFYIDGTKVCTSIANLPAANTLVRYVNTVTTLAAAIRNMQVGYVYLESNK